MPGSQLSFDARVVLTTVLELRVAEPRCADVEDCAQVAVIASAPFAVGVFAVDISVFVIVYAVGANLNRVTSGISTGPTNALTDISDAVDGRALGAEEAAAVDCASARWAL